MNNFVENYTKEISRIIRDGQIEGSIKEELIPEDVAMFFIGSIQAKVFAYVISGREGRIIEDPDQFIKMIFYGIMKR
ncbi:MAG: hypothetical protein Q9M89_05210 [Persephonella sp.]|nr:hypothetical protein [Persephonella sp.]